MKCWMMMLLLMSCIFLFTVNMQAQYRVNQQDQTNEYSLTGNLHYDLSPYAAVDSVQAPSVNKRKAVYRKTYSPLIAGMLSAAVPGAGQFYTKAYWQSAAFFGAEVLAWIVYANYLNSGDAKTDEFQKYADAHWSVVRYAHWIESSGLNSGYTPFKVINSEQPIQGGTIVRHPDNIPEPWKYVNWGELNICEDNISRLNTTTGFTHKLEYYGEQQYYEMIGKYAQFGGGWDDAATFKPDGSPFSSYDIISKPANVSPRFTAYSKMRGEANNAYTIATTVSYLIVANHVFSALEAAWNAAKINNRIKLQGHIESRKVEGNMVEFVPTLHFECEL